MSLQDSTFRTSHAMDNEIIKASDFEFAFEQIAENVSKATQMLLESNQDFVINGKVLPASGMNLKVSPIYGVCKSSGIPFGRTEETDETIAFAGSTLGRVDILEVKGEWETYDNQQRAFNDPDTDTQTYQYVDTKKLMKPIYRVLEGVEGSGIAPEVEDGWVKLAEVVIEPGVSEIYEENIKNITADVAGMENADWTTEKDATYNIGYISQVNERFRVQHNEDGTHKDDSINSDSLDIGTGTKQINGNILPIGGSVSIPGQTVAATDSIISVITKAVAVITTIYNSYIKYGAYNFKGSLNVSALADSGNNLVKPITINANGDGTASILIDGNTVLSIDGVGRLSTNGYTATSNNHIVTKVVTDAISTALTALAQRVTTLEQNATSSTKYSNGVLSVGSNGRYNLDSVTINYATTTNITLSGSQTIDGKTPNNGDFILVKNQTDSKENGIYEYSSSSSWSRVTAYYQPISLKGKLFQVQSGNTNTGKIFYILNETFENSETFGTDSIDFYEYLGSLKTLANHLVMRDANGRAKVCAPSALDDIARKQEICDLYSTTVKGTELGTAAVGTCTTFARSDHVHPLPDTIANATCFDGHTYEEAKADFSGDYAPTCHSSTLTSYGVGTASAYGHLKISDQYTSVLADCTGVAASQKAVYCAYNCGRAVANLSAGVAFQCSATGEASAATYTKNLTYSRSFRWCCCPQNVCSFDRRTYFNVGTVQNQNACSGYSFIETCSWQCCYSGTAGVTTCSTKRFCFCSNGYFYAPNGICASSLCGCASDSAKLGGCAASCYLTAGCTIANAECVCVIDHSCSDGNYSLAFVCCSGDQSSIVRTKATLCTWCATSEENCYCLTLPRGIIKTCRVYGCSCVNVVAFAGNATGLFGLLHGTVCISPNRQDDSGYIYVCSTSSGSSWCHCVKICYGTSNCTLFKVIALPGCNSLYNTACTYPEMVIPACCWVPIKICCNSASCIQCQFGTCMRIIAYPVGVR